MVVVLVIVILALGAGLLYFILRRRQSRANLPHSNSATEDIGLTHMDKDSKDQKAESLSSDPNSPYPPYKKLDSESGEYREQKPDGELGTQGEIYQMPTTEHGEGDYFTAVNRIESERRAATTPQIDGRSVMYELHGSEPLAVEMDGQARKGSPMLSPRTPVTRGSSRSSSFGPVSTTL